MLVQDGFAKTLFFDEEGMTTAGMAVALLLTISLLFSSAQVYRVNSVSSEVQSVADAAVLAAENEVAEFMIVVRLCDAVVLTLSLAGLTVTGLGVAALCTPVTAPLSEQLLSAGKKVSDARDAFARRAASALNSLQRALPFLAAANASSVASASGSGSGASYVALAVLAPVKAEEIEVGVPKGMSEAQDAADSEADEVRDLAARAEEAAARADEAKRRAFHHDCGASPGYCMQERAATLVGLDPVDNPLYRSVDTWSFSVALKRAQAYYAQRLSAESPEGSSVEDKVRSALRSKFYEYANREVGRGHVTEHEGFFEADFPRLPRNTDEMRSTSLYEDRAYPRTSDGEGRSTLHAWDGCPKAASPLGTGSIREMEEGSYATCPTCEFTAASLGKVAAASTSIENGFEHHYDIVAEAAAEYQAARAEADPLSSEVRERVGSLLDMVADGLASAGSMRIDARPPGSLGAFAFVATTGETSTALGAGGAFSGAAGVLGTRAALSAATLVEEPAGEGATVISSALDSLAADGGAAVGAAGIVLDGWSALLKAYAEGQGALEGAVEEALGGIPLGQGSSGLGSWAKDALKGAVAKAGLEPAKLDALKPVLVNSGHVAAADGGSVSAKLLDLKKRAIATPLDANDPFSSAVGALEQGAIEGIESFDGKVTIATIEVLGEGGPSIPIEIALPQAAKNFAVSIVEQAAARLRSVFAQVTGVRVWE